MYFRCDNLMMDDVVDVRDCCRRAEELFELYQRCANRKQIETICANFLRSLDATKLSIAGHMYFVPKTYMEKVDIFEDFINLLGDLNRNNTPLMVNSFYIIDDEKQRGKMTEEFYAAVREQYSIFQKDLTMAQLTDYWSPEIKKTSALYYVIEVEDDSQKIGYIAVKDTSKELWEIAIELDKAHCGQGCGSKAITLFLKRLNEITTKNQFQFLVEVDNIPCQRCMRKPAQN